MFDPYARDTPGVSDPANSMYLIEPSDSEELPKGVKALRVWNPNDADATLVVITKAGDLISLSIPARTVWVEALRVTVVRESGTTSGLEIHGYTD